MFIDELIKRPNSWLSMDRSTGIIISSRVRLARNIMNARFPGRADEAELRKVYDKIRGAIGSVQCLRDPLFFEMSSMDAVDREVLRERRLISNELVDKGEGSALVVAESERIAIMINEEDHLRLTAISPGNELYSTWKLIDDVDSELENHVDYAFNNRLGYLSTCPSNVGTGLRASVMMHLSGLRLIGEIGQVIKGLEKMGFAVRGLLGEGSDAYGNMFQISNQSTLGQTEESIIETLFDMISEIVVHEQNARQRLMETRKSYVYDQIGRAYGVLGNARILSSNETVDMLSGLRLGLELGVVDGLDICQLNELLMLIQPGHLQKIEDKVLSPDERDEVRAKIVRDKMKNVSIVS